MTDNTQELDEILEDLVRDSQEDVSDFKLNSLPHELIGKNGAKQAIIDWHNKQVEAVLDRLEGRARGVFDYEADIEEYAEDVLTSIEAEHNRLNPSKSTPFNKLKESSND